MSRSGRMKGVRRIVSHPQSLGQCRQWLAQHFPGLPQIEAASNAQAADGRGPRPAPRRHRRARRRRAIRAQGDRGEHSGSGAQLHALPGHRPDGIGQPSGDDKTSLLLSLRHQAGALHRVLKPFADNGVSICTIESRPLKERAWEYLFFLDLVGHVQEPRVAKALAAVKKRCLLLKVLGILSRRRRGRCERYGSRYQISGPRMDPLAGAVPAGQADRRAGARVRHLRLDQAGLEREPARPVAEGGGRDPAGARQPAPLSGRQLLLSEAGGGQEARHLPGCAHLRQRLERDHRAGRAHLHAARRRSGHGGSGLRRSIAWSCRPRAASAGSCRCATTRTISKPSRKRSRRRRGSSSWPTPTIRPGPSSSGASGRTSSPPCRRT